MPEPTPKPTRIWCEQHTQHECGAKSKRSQERCHAPQITGSNPPRCRMHISHARAKADIVAAVARWTDDMSTLDPGETLLRLMTIAYLRAEQHADELDKILQTHGWTDAFVGDTYAVVGAGDDAELKKVGEYARQLAVWEATERKHAADLAARAVAAGLEERRVRVAEEQVTLFAQALDAALADLGLEDRKAEVTSGVARHLRAIAG